MTTTAKKQIVLATTFVATIALVLVALQRPTRAQASGDDGVHFKIAPGSSGLYKMAVPLPLGDAGTAKTASDVLSNDLSLSGYFKIVDPAGYLANLQAEQLTINPQDWRNVGAEGVIKARATGYGSEVKYEFRLFEVAKGDQPVLAKDYRGSITGARLLAHQFANEVVKYYTGEDGFFASQMAFAGDTGARRRDLFVMDWDGYGAHAITHSSQNILPSWSPSGNELAFTSFAANKPDLYLIPASGGKPRSISSRPGLNMGASFSPDGQKIAVTLSQDNNSEIYLLSRDGAILKRLTNTPFIDTSPSFSPDGSRIAFVSDRHGSPQIWVMNADGSNQQKVTRRGNYNQEPAWCPRKDVSLIAFSARDEKMAYDIFTVNVDTGEMVRVTEGHGSNVHPTWAPNGRAVAYESSRGGLWISTADGRTERQVYKGSVKAPAWGPSLSKK
ncbi:MAG TPA: Tol-Pal system beta propeller repeat protein TolB [Polyangia bacterium]|nr:Tol-Pal system beta propeller repeat protein TolB [Polyangia bacterium]